MTARNRSTFKILSRHIIFYRPTRWYSRFLDPCGSVEAVLRSLAPQLLLLLPVSAGPICPSAKRLFVEFEWRPTALPTMGSCLVPLKSEQVGWETLDPHWQH